jgi:hypothetical protein
MSYILADGDVGVAGACGFFAFPTVVPGAGFAVLPAAAGIAMPCMPA